MKHVVKTLEQRLERKVDRTLKSLLPQVKVLPPKPAIELTADEEPSYKAGTLLIPHKFARDKDADLDYCIGKLAGLVLLYHRNDFVQHLFKTVAEPEYKFWSHLSMTYAGLLAVRSKRGAHEANQKAVVCRMTLQDVAPIDKESAKDQLAAYAKAVAKDYAAQLFLRFGDQKFKDVLGLRHPFEVHELVRVNEYFYHFVAKDW